MKNFLPRNKQVWMLAAALLASSPALHAANTDISNVPVATTSGVKPNIMFMLDDSSSMAHDFMPDKIDGAPNQCRGSSNSNCDNGNPGDLNGTTVSGPPYFAAQYNTLAYDPKATYSPPVDFDGTNNTFQSYDNSFGHLWSAVKINPWSSTTTTNLTNSFPEEVWCDPSATTPTDAVHCRRNGLTNPTFSVSFGSVVTGTPNKLVVTLANNGCQSNDIVKFVNVAAPYNSATGFKVLSATASNFTIDTGAVTSNPSVSPSGATPAVTACNIPITKISTFPAGGVTNVIAVFPIPHGCVNGESVTFKALPVVTGPPPSYQETKLVTVVDERTLTYPTTTPPSAAESSGGSAPFVAESSLCAGTRSNYSNAGSGGTSTTVPPLMQGFPQGIFTNLKTRLGGPFFYTIGANEYCTDLSLTQCQAPVSETVGTTAYTVPVLVRGCSSTADVNANPAAATTSCGRLFIKASPARYGYFKRTDIVSGSTYPKASGRPDCANATFCTFSEEMTNFANWYAYYRTRIQMAKSAVGTAFKSVNQNYRVGYNGLNNLATSGFKYLPIAPFDSTPGGQKSQWYALLYSVTGNGSGYKDPGGGGATPLRETLSRIGRYYAGMKTAAAPYMTDDPVQYSCQQNFYLFTTDGYWNTTPGPIKLDGTAMGDQDGAAKGVPRPFMDGFNSASADGLGTLADAAFYYYNTDLRTPSFNPIGALGTDVTQNDVSPTASDPATWQHMTTFSMGFGVDGDVIYAPNYQTPGNSPDYDAIVNGTPCSFSGGSPCNWPIPGSGGIATADDLWHAAVNGHGIYYSVKNPADVVAGITNSVINIAQRTSAVAASITSNPNLQSGDNFLFSTTFTTREWDSQVTRRMIDPNTGTISSNVDWTAQAQLDAMTTAGSDTRNIKTFDSTNASTHMKDFLWANLTPTEQGFFNGGSGGRQFLGQWSVLTSVQQSNCDNPGGADCGQKLVNYLRGQRGFETTSAGNTTLNPDPGVNSLFRNRVHILGDVVNAEAAYVRQPIFNYFDQGYSAFKAAQASRPGTLYVAANDGMLHAFDSTTGAERWAYIPSMVMPNMWKLADFSYANNHVYLVDGTPVIGDICTSNNCNSASATWATILVGGLNAGGRGYYALDITDPLNPKALWELKSTDASGNPASCISLQGGVPKDPVQNNTFSDCDIGLSFGNPIITKRADGTWVVLVTSGYNNVSPGTGGGFLYVVNAVTGAIQNKIATLLPGGTTNAGNTVTPSGFAKINAFVSNTINDNTTLRVYGGDLNGNLWRIDSSSTPNTLQSSGNNATLLAILGTANALNTQGNGTANVAANDITVGSQSITTKPELGEVQVAGVGTFEMVYVGTGRYLGTSDPAFVGRQTFYGIKDPLGSFAGYGVVHNGLPGSSNNMVQQTMTQVVNSTTGATERHLTANTVNLQTKNGWFIDLDPGTSSPGASPGERSNTDPSLDLGILSFTTNKPNSNTCEVGGGSSFIYFVDFTTGGPLPANMASGLGGKLLDTSLASRVVVVRVGTQVIGITVVGSQPNTPVETTLGTAPISASGKRINWRELNF